MPKDNNNKTFTKIVDETVKISNKSGNGILRIEITTNIEGTVYRYNLAYINHHICNVDNGRVLGYDNAHGYHHRHFMGKEEPVNFTKFETIAEQFECEWRELHEQLKKEKNFRTSFKN